MIESLKSLWIAQDQTNMAQWGDDVLQKMKSFGFCKSFFDLDSNFPIKDEYWKYNKFTGLKDRQLQFPEPGSQNLIHKVSDGQYVVEVWDLSQGASWDLQDLDEVFPVSEIFTDEDRFRRWIPFFQREWPSNFISDFNRSFVYSGLAFAVDPGEEITLHIHYHVQGGSKDFLPLHLLGRVGEQGKVEIFESFSAEQFKGVSTYDRLFVLEKGAQAHFLSHEQGSENSHIFQNTYIQMAEDCLWNGLDLTLPSLWSRHNTTSQMMGPGGQSNFYGLYLNDKDFFCDHHTAVEHLSPHTGSKQIYKGVLAGVSEAVFNGKVHIAPGAEKSHSEQLNKNLLLSDRAEIHTKPELKIYNDDVKAAHGATVGQLDPEQLFYFLSRGLSEEVAWSYLCQSFTGDIFGEFSSEVFPDLESVVAEKLEGMRPQNHV